MRPAYVNPADISDYQLVLHDAYDDYTRTVSPGRMAVALATAAYLLHLCEAIRPGEVADFGSGFTSYVLARYAATAGRPVAVVSVDDNADWLDRTAEFLDRHRLTSDLRLWADFTAAPALSDVAVYDLGHGAVRDEGMGLVLTHTRRAVLFDDAQHAGHRQTMARCCRTTRASLYFLQDETTDGYGRFAALAVRP